MATLAASVRFNPKGTRKVYYLTSLAASNLTPTRAEITAGTDITGEVAAYTGWTLQASSVATPDQGSRFTSSVPGSLTVQDSSITFWASKTGTDIRGTVSLDQDGFVVFADGGDVEGYKGQTFATRVMSIGHVRAVDDNAFQIQVQFAITETPVEFAIPAAA